MNAANGLHFFDDGFEGIDVLFVFGLHAEHDVAVHLYETTIGVVDEVGVARLGRQACGNFVVETEVQDCVHHAGHGSTGTGTYGNQQGIRGIAEFAIHAGFRFGDGCSHRFGEFCHDGVLTNTVIVVARCGGDRKTGRNGHTDFIHFGKVRTFTTEQITHGCVAFGFSVAECVNSFYLFHMLDDCFYFV